MSSWGVGIRFEDQQVVAVTCYPQDRGSPRKMGSPAEWRYVTGLTAEQARALEQVVAAAIASARPAQGEATEPTPCPTGLARTL